MSYLSENVEFLHIIAKRLLEVETISGKEFETMYKKYMGIEEEKEEVVEETVAEKKDSIDEISSTAETTEETEEEATDVEKTKTE